MFWNTSDSEDSFLIEQDGRVYEVRSISRQPDCFTFLGVDYLEQVGLDKDYSPVVLAGHQEPIQVMAVRDGKGGNRYQVEDRPYGGLGMRVLTLDECRKARARYLVMREQARVLLTTSGEHLQFRLRERLLKVWFRGRMPEPLCLPPLPAREAPSPIHLESGEQFLLDFIREAGGFVEVDGESLSFMDIESGRKISIAYELRTVSTLVRKGLIWQKQCRHGRRYYLKGDSSGNS